MNNGKEIWDKLLGLGKDRYLILLGIGLMCVVIASRLDAGQKQTGGADSAKAQGQTVEDRQQAAEVSLWQTVSGAGEETAGATESVGIGEDSLIRYAAYYQRGLEALLSQMEGAGKVSVLVTMQTSESLVLERDTPYSRKTEEQSSQEGTRAMTDTQSDSKVVFYQNDKGRSTPIVVKRYAPRVEGIVVLTQGGNDPKVRANITQLLMALFELPEHKIKVANYHT